MSRPRIAVSLVLTVVSAVLVTGCVRSGEGTMPSTLGVVTRAPLPPAAVVKGTLDVAEKGTDEKVWYEFTVKLTESNGVALNVNKAWVGFDSGWGGECSFTGSTLGVSRVPANGTLTLGPLTCSNGDVGAVDASFELTLTDDNGNRPSFRASWSRAGKL
jgi:hypothetical protein